MTKKLDLLYGVICSHCGGVITIHVTDEGAQVRHKGEILAPAPWRRPEPFAGLPTDLQPASGRND